MKNIFAVIFLLWPFAGIISAHEGAVSDTIFVRGTAVLPLPDTMAFCGEPILTADRDVRERLEDIFFQVLNREERVVTVLKRAPVYFPFFEKVLSEMGLPEDLKYLSVAESSLRLDAYSHADAGGLWQFIPSTAKIWGLTVNAMIDERFHVEKSTRASLAMLRSMRGDFGNWSLAAAAYNAGPGYIKKMIGQQTDSNYYRLFLNRETRNYLFHILVIKEIMERPHRYGFRIPESAKYRPYDEGCKTVTVRGPLKDLGKWIRNSGMNYKQLKTLNYWIMKDQLPEGEWSLLVPCHITLTDTIRNNRNQDSAVTVNPAAAGDSSLHYIFYTVQEGDHLSKIAGRYQVTPGNLMLWNQLKSDVAMLGAKLKIYYPRAKAVEHEVRDGENLYRIAEKYRLSIYQIRQWNNIPGDQIQTGMNLVLYVPEE